MDVKEHWRVGLHYGSQGTLTSWLNSVDVTSPVDIRKAFENGASKLSRYGTIARAVQFENLTLKMEGHEH